MEDKDFLQDYEIKAIDLGPRIYKIFTLAAAINLIAIAVIGQTNMLARSACESPFVNRVCSVLDAVYFSSKLLATDAGYVVQEYQETKIKDADVVWIDQTNVEPSLQYPTGYFQIANRDELAMLEGDPLQIIPSDPILPPAPILPPSNSPKNPFGTKPILPKKRDSVVEGDLPDDPLAGIGDDPTPGNGTVAGNDPKTGKTPNGKADNDNSPLPDVEINKQPLYDFVDGVVEKVNAKKVDLRRQFKVVMNAHITEDGKLDIEKSRWDPEAEQGDPEMILVAKDAVEKVGDSGWLVYLSEQGIKNVKIIFYQDEEKLAADIVSVMPSRNNARMVASGFRTMKSFALNLHKNGTRVLKDDEVVLLNAAEITNENNLLMINFNLKKDIAQQIIDTRLKEYQADKAKKKIPTPTPRQPNGKLEKSNSRERSAR